MQVILRLSEPSLAQAGGRHSQLQRVASQQQALDAALAAAGARKLGALSKTLNAVMVEVDASQLSSLAANPSVTAIREIGRYHKTLDETVSHIGAAVELVGDNDGSGISVGVVDSGIDYYHAALGGSGIVDDYLNDSGTVREDGTFPTEKVVGGWDFVGSIWPDPNDVVPGDGLAEDPDPLDDGDEAGHGTHVAHIIGGEGNVDLGIPPGVAPGVDLWALKVCSSVSTSCSGVALLNSIEYAADPDGDPETDDHLDILNLSLGSNYGQAFDDDLSAAIDGATALGILTVASAGNASDKPYIVGTPSATPSALSVAQTQVPSASLQLISAGGQDVPAVFQPWSVEPDGTVEGPIRYGNSDGSNLNGCKPYDAGTFDGSIALIDRGGCNFTLKILNAELAGASAGIIGLVAPGAPFSGGDGGDGPITIPGYMISQSASNFLKSLDEDSVAAIDPDNGLPLVNQMVGSSSRGPTLQFNALIKPEIGAPGASVSAIAGSGTGTGPFGGTSGAAPMVSGAAALVLAADTDLSPAEVRAKLVTTGDTNIDTDPFSGLAPVARIGGGEVRANRALNTAVSAWDVDTLSPALSFGFLDAFEETTLSKTVVVTNYGDSDVSYAVSSAFRYAADDNGAVSVDASQSSIDVPAGGSVEFDVTLTVSPEDLTAWYGNSGSLGADPAWITDLEYDGYVNLDADGVDNDIHLPWHILPRKSGNLAVSLSGKGQFTLSNEGVGDTLVESYNLIATSDDLPEGERGANNPITDFKALGYRTTAVPAGYCSAEKSFVIQFAVASWERQTHANVPNAWDLYLDYNGDGFPEANVFNYELAGNLSDGRNAVIATDYVGGTQTIYFLTDHETNSANTVLTVCAEQIGLDGRGLTHKAQVAFGGAYDLYFTGEYTDFLTEFELSPGVDDSPVTFQGNKSGYTVLPNGGSVKGTRSGKTGALLLFRGGAPEGNEHVIIE
ncbi:S8 family serine peptidase [Parahaliea maris]|uniref:S8 family serine peptidase n=1 Tax=Parahaliea maris TaxID=2716870 RepID=A0A5C8ZWH0_9GAMM|nr:S8 family serine peptidase [Parahaliea maris]TXS92778.1 S8 family serine peptidase [Parahaliea maris]